MKKNYVVLGDNNFWYSYLDGVTEKELQKELKQIKTNIKKGMYGESQTVNCLRIFETVWTNTVEIN